MSLDRLIENIIEKQNPTVAGLDPKLSYIPTYIKESCFEKYGHTLEGAAAALFEFNKGLIDALHTIVPAVKPQCAYYEMYGWQGMKALHDTIAYAKEKGMFVVTDGKRNDIGTTMEAYAVAHLGQVDVQGEKIAPFAGDSLTVNGYLGSDGILSLLDICDKQDKGIFVLVKTSNPSSGELQDLKLDSNESIYETMGHMCEAWGAEHMGKYGYLVPGYGAQGGGADDVAPGFDQKGLGALINSSRGIMCAWQKNQVTETDYAKAAAEEAIRMRDELITRIGKIG